MPSRRKQKGEKKKLFINWKDNINVTCFCVPKKKEGFKGWKHFKQWIMRQLCTAASKKDVLLVLCLILSSYGLHVAGCCHATRWQQIPSIHEVPCVCCYSDSCCAPPRCTEPFECFCFFFFSLYLQTLVPNLEEAVPGPCCHCHAVVGHTQAAHPVVVTRQDTCGEATGWDAVWWLPYVKADFEDI